MTDAPVVDSGAAAPASGVAPDKAAEAQQGDATPAGAANGNEADAFDLPEAEVVAGDGRLDSLLGNLSGSPITTGRIESSGQTALGPGSIAAQTVYLNYSTTGGDGQRRAGVLAARFMEETRDAYGVAGTDALLDEALARHAAVYLAGAPGTGRETTARLALGRRHGMGRVAGLSSRADADTVAGRIDLPDEHGLVVDVSTQAPNLVQITKIEEWAGQRKCSVVLIGTDVDKLADLADHGVQHRPAPPIAAFRAQLAHHLRRGGACLGGCADCAGRCIDRFADGCLSDAGFTSYLGETVSLPEIIATARTIAASAAQGHGTAAALNAVLPGMRRRMAQRALWATPDEPRADGHPPQSDPEYRRAFRIAYAVFDGEPLNRVVSAAHHLHAPKIYAANAEPRSSFGLYLDALLPAGMRAAETTPGTVGSPRCASLADKPLVSDILDVAWNEWGLSVQLMDWVDVLVQSTEPGVSDRAAMLAGRLAFYDMAYVFSKRIDVWADDQSRRLRQAAAYAVAAASFEPRLRPDLRQRLRRWQEHGARTRDALVRAHCLRIDARLGTDTAFTDLHAAAERDAMQKRSWGIAVAVERNYTPGSANKVIDTLLRWSRSEDPKLVLHGARGFLKLLQRRADRPGAAAPDLLHRLQEAAVGLEAAAELWMLALSHPATAAAAWSALDDWLAAGAAYASLGETFTHLVRLLCDAAPMRRRLDQHLRYVWRRQQAPSATLNAVATVIEEVTHGN